MHIAIAGNIGSGKTPELTQQRIDQAVERNKKYDGVRVDGWTESETNTMWSYHYDELNRLKVEGQSTRQIAQHVEQFFQC